MNISNFSYEFTPTESTPGGTLSQIADHLEYQRKNDLNFFEKNYLESAFVEITNPPNTNIIMGCSIDIHQQILINSVVTFSIHFQKKQSKNKKLPFFLMTLKLIY